MRRRERDMKTKALLFAVFVTATLLVPHCVGQTNGVFLRNAFDGFVKRLKGPSPLTVDAMTGATQTCNGILLAVEDALRKAAPNDRR